MKAQVLNTVVWKDNKLKHKEIAYGTFQSILKQASIDIEELSKLI